MFEVTKSFSSSEKNEKMLICQNAPTPLSNVMDNSLDFIFEILASIENINH